MASSSIVSRWRELSGEKNWEGLLHPLHLELRRYLIHYCQRAGAAGDAFNGTKASKGYAHSLYPADEFFARVGLENGNPYHYKVTNFIYATNSDTEVAYFGYVATDEGKLVLGRRDILVSWRGTITMTEWDNDANILQTSAKELFGTDFAQVHAGFYNTYTKSIADHPYANTSARDQSFCYEWFHILRIVNSTDPVPGIYFDVGQELGIDQHAIAGLQENGEFKLEEELDFDNPVINKYSDGLLDKYKIPDNWWTKELFKNMVQTDDGDWKFNDTAHIPDPPMA